MCPASPGLSPAGNLIIFHAGSLTVPLAQFEKDFEAKYPRVDVLREGGRSTKMARLISEAGKPADIMASADYTVIDATLIPENADWNIRFATNQLAACLMVTGPMAAWSGLMICLFFTAFCQDLTFFMIFV